MTTMMIVSLNQGKGFAEDALRPLPRFDLAERLGAVLAAIAARLATRAALRPAHA